MSLIKKYAEKQGIDLHEKKKKGFFQKVGTGLKNAVKSSVEGYKEYKANEPERQKKHLARLKTQEKMLNAKSRVMHQQNKIRKLQRQQMANNPLLGGGSSGFGMSQNPFEGQPVHKPSQQKKKSTGKPKRKEVFYY